MKDNRSKSRSRSKSKDVEEEEMQTNNDQQIDEKNGATRPDNEEHQQSGD